MEDSIVKLNSMKAWLLAARPKTLSGAAVPVLIGWALAVRYVGWHVRWWPVLLCLLFAFLMQIDANFVNDYFDFRRGNDDAATRLGPPRACSMGWVSPRAMLWAIGLTTMLSCLVGLPLIYYGGWMLIGIGVACVVFCFLYTLCLSYWGLGDLLVLVFFGWVPVGLTYWLALPAGSAIDWWPVVLSGTGCGLAIDALLIVNNYRDIHNDRRDGKRTLVVRLGERNGRRLYLVVGILAALLGFSVFYLIPCDWDFLIIIYLLDHCETYRKMKRIGQGRALNRVLGRTAINIILYGVGFALPLLVEGLF